MRITSSYFCAGLVMAEGCVIRAAPILRYMHGWTRESVQSYCRMKDWKCEWL